jgi:hypothetical protein
MMIEQDPLSATERECRRRELAYKLWQEEGQPNDQAEVHWCKAGLMLLDLGKQEQGDRVPVWLQRHGLEQVTKDTAGGTEIHELRERIKKRVA